MYENSNRVTVSSQNSEIHQGSQEFIPEEKRMVRKMNKKMEKKPFLKQFFYDFVAKNNNKYQVLNPKDAEDFRYQTKLMERKVNGTYLGFCLLFGATYLMTRSFQSRSKTIFRHGVKLFSIVVVLPAIPTGILTPYLCMKERQRMYDIADKYPIEDERIYRDFFGYAVPKLKEKYFEELDKQKKDHI